MAPGRTGPLGWNRVSTRNGGYQKLSLYGTVIRATWLETAVSPGYDFNSLSQFPNIHGTDVLRTVQRIRPKWACGNSTNVESKLTRAVLGGEYYPLPDFHDNSGTALVIDTKLAVPSCASIWHILWKIWRNPWKIFGKKWVLWRHYMRFSRKIRPIFKQPHLLQLSSNFRL